MKILKIMIKNALRHKLRTSLTILGISVAVIAFIVMRTIITAWNIGVEAASADRLIVRNSVSFIFPLPVAYREKIGKVDGVNVVSYANWFQGVYKDKSNFFARLAVDHKTFFEVYPEYMITNDEKAELAKEISGCVIGRATAEQFGIKKGDIVTLEGDIYPGIWDFKVVAIYQPRDKITDATGMLFRWDYVNQRLEKEDPIRANEIGWYIVQVNDVNKTAAISAKIDSYFKNSTNETKTETEKSFNQGFLASTDAIITAMNVVSYVIIGIIILVLGNTMIMAARERTREYSVLKTLGFSGKHLTGLILGESMVIASIGAVVGLLLALQLVAGLNQVVPKTIFPVLEVKTITIVFAIAAALLVGLIASVFPIHKAINTKIVEGLRFVG
ncbi:MAG: FtsX-like permease family protein [Ignavibacteriaceae bacterium]|nr:FtsX-like permease family protein [Ignavibacteriaceae bacterium]